MLCQLSYIPILLCLFYFHKIPLWATVDAEINDPSVENPVIESSPFKPGAGPFIAMHATPTAKALFPANFYLPGPLSCNFSQTSPVFFLC